MTDLFAGWLAAEEQLLAPSLLPYEVANALYRQLRAGILSGDECRAAMGAVRALDIELLHPPELGERALELAARLKLPAAYDAHYLALAQLLGVTLYTADLRLARAASQAFDWVVPVELG